MPTAIRKAGARVVFLVLAPLLAVGAALTACGSDSGRSRATDRVTATAEGRTPASAADSAGTPRPVASDTGSAAPAQQPATAAAPPSTPGAAPQAVTVVAALISFTTTELLVQAGQPVTLTFKNEARVAQGSILHNWHALGVNDGTGVEPATALIAGGQQATITFALTTPGTYTFICDVHPNEMVGRLVVQSG